MSTNDPHGKKQIFLLITGSITIGRSVDSDVVVNDELVSSSHCKISIKNNIIAISDLNSKNGVFLNDIKIINQRLYIDDKVKIGKTVIIFENSEMDQVALDFLKSEKPATTKGDKRSLTVELQAALKKNRKKTNSRYDYKKLTATNKKLYAGVEDINTNGEDKGEEPSSLRIFAARNIDTLLLILSFFVPATILYVFNNELFQSICIKNGKIGILSLKDQSSQYLLLSSLFTMFIFYKINRFKLERTIGEIILRID